MPGQRGAIVRIAQSITAGCPDYSTREARRVFRGGPCISPRIPHRGRWRSMFTVKPANDTEEFYEAIRGQATAAVGQGLSLSADKSESRHGRPILQPSG